MIFITKDKIAELSNWILQGNEIISENSIFHEILNPLVSIMKKNEIEKIKWKSLKQLIEKQIKDHPSYIDLTECAID